MRHIIRVLLKKSIDRGKYTFHSVHSKNQNILSILFFGLGIIIVYYIYSIIIIWLVIVVVVLKSTNGNGNRT